MRKSELIELVLVLLGSIAIATVLVCLGLTADDVGSAVYWYSVAN